MRDIVFLVPCNGIKMAVTGFFQRIDCFGDIGCASFDFDPIKDIFKEGSGNDSGVYKEGHLYLARMIEEYHKAVIILDAQFPGSPGKDIIETEITQRMIATGWNQSQFIVIVLDPELEILMWQHDNTVLSDLINFNAHDGGINEWLIENEFVRGDQVKPNDPKTALDAALKLNISGRNISHSKVCKRVAAQVNFDDCIDQPFLNLLNQFKRWFPNTNQPVTAIVSEALVHEN